MNKYDRLTLAAQILSGILANPERKQSTEIAVDIALKHTDELIKRANALDCEAKEEQIGGYQPRATAAKQNHPPKRR